MPPHQPAPPQGPIPPTPHREPHRQRAPYGGPQRPPGEEGGAPPSEGPITEVAPPPRRFGLRARRLTEVTALVLVLSSTIGLRWYDDSGQARALERPESVTVVTPGHTGTLGQVQWKMLGRGGGAPTGTPAAGGAARLTLFVEARPLNAQGVKDLTGARLTFRVRDREGHEWSADADTPTEARPGVTVRVPVTAGVPADRLTSVVLDVLQSSTYAKQGRPLPVLRFAH